jgi:hypothetical protein
LQIEIALAGLALKLIVVTRATIGWPQSSDHFVVYPAARTLEIISAHGHEATKALQQYEGELLFQPLLSRLPTVYAEGPQHRPSRPWRIL